MSTFRPLRQCPPETPVPSTSTPLNRHGIGGHGVKAEGHLPDLKSVQIVRLKDENTALRRRLADRERDVTELTTLKTTAISRLAAQHAEITRLRAALAARGNVRALPSPALAPPEHTSTAGTLSRGTERRRLR
jgi:hypothetical protein